MNDPLTSQIGVVVIGRNEGERLRRCLESVLPVAKTTVYVDSGSTDDSQELARSLGVHVVTLDTSVPFTAARARNAGFERLLEIDPSCVYVQFVDGDCEVNPDWLAIARAELDRQTDVVAVCGRRRERHPHATVYNRLCDLEWDTPIGEAAACGGDAMMRVESLREVGGYNSTLIAGEEPELCVRLRLKGGKIMRLNAEMTLHDAAMTQFGQWWKRAVRAGHAYAQGAAIHGRGPTRHCMKEVRSIVFWAVALPVAGVGLVVAGGWLWGVMGACATAVMMIGPYGLLLLRIMWSQLRRGRVQLDSFLFAEFCVLGKFAQAVGVFRYWTNRFLRRRHTLIEYK